MAVSLLEDSLRSLHSLHENSSGGSREQIDTVVSDIQQICLNELSEKDVDFCCSALFDKEIGIVRFLQKIVTADEYQGCKASLLDLLAGFISKVGKKILVYAVDIKEISFSLFTRDRFAKVKNAAIPVIIKLLEVSVGSSLGEQLKISKLIEKLFMELTKSSSKLQATVKANVYQLLGVISEVYPELMAVYSERLVGLYVNALKAEMEAKTRKPELPVIAGCLEGLTAYLVNFTQSAGEGSKHSYAIFKYARMAIDPKVNYSRYDVPRGGLRLFGKHCGQFDQYITDDYQGMYEKFHSWNKHHNRELAHLGMVAMEGFLKQVADMLVIRAQEGKKEGAVFKFFIKQFRDIMNDNSSTSKEVSLAIRGYGLLAAPCRSFLSPADVQFMFAEMISKCEQQFLGQQEDLEERIVSLPSYLEALAYIVKEVDQVSDTYAATLEHLLVLLLEHFPLVYKKLHFYCEKATLQVLLALMSKGTTFQQVLSGMVYQGLIRTCSHPVVLDTEQTDEQTPADVSERKVTYKDYIDLWQSLLNSARIKDFASEDISIADRHRLTEAMYDELMNSILKVLNKLDLSSATGQGGEAVADEADDTLGTSADPTSGVQANRPRDFQVLINLVDFSRDLLLVCHYELFERWVFTFCHSIILLSSQNPLVSGFYKMLSVAMKIANKLEYFKEMTPASPMKLEESMEVDTQTDGHSQKPVSYQLMKKFSKEVLVRMKQYRDDLLAACLTLILSLPKEIIAEQMSDIVPAIQVTFTLGLSYLPLAVVGLDALEYWSNHLPEHILYPHYAAILPHLDSYLRTVDKGAEEVNVDSTVTLKTSKSRRGKSKVTVKKVKTQAKKEDKGYESQLAVVKQRIMHYLGSLGGAVNHALLANADEEISKQAIAWDTKQHLKFDMPFIDMKPVIYFDKFLPHVVELASKSGDRQTKVAACELLHSLVLYTLGRGAHLPGEKQNKMPMDRLYKNLFPAILQLACDVELVARQLFEPLTMQLIHWFTNNKMEESMETMSLLDTIFDGITQPKDTALRDFSARCLREFLKWSLKQSSKKSVEKSPVNAKSVLKRIFSFAVHPSAFKRLGAALAFNNIYTVFREEDSLVDRFTFQILVYFVESLSIAHADEKSLGTREQCSKALEHLEKIIKGKANLLKKDSKIREEPKEWSKKTLDIAVRWLTRQCGRPQTDCRHSCMKLVHSLAPLIQGINTSRDYFKAFLKSKEGPVYFLSRFEGGSQAEYGKMGLSSCPQLSEISDTFSLSAALSWFDMLLAALDCYTWVFGEELLTPADLFTGAGKTKCQVFSSIQYFCENLSLHGIQEAAVLFKHRSTVDFFTPREIDEYNRAKCTVIVRIWNFLVVLYGRYAKDTGKIVPDSVLCESLWVLLCRCVVHPSSTGFNMGDVEIMVNLPKEMEQVLYVFSRSLPVPHLKNLRSTLGKQLKGDKDLFGMLPLSLTDPDVDQPIMQQLVSGYGQLHKHGLLLDAVKQGGKTDKLAKTIMDNVYTGIIKRKDGDVKLSNLSPTALSLAKTLLQFAFQLGLPDEDLLESLLESKFVIGLSQGLEQSHGDLFFSLFKSTISAHIVQRADKMISLIAQQASTEPRRVSGLLVNMLDHVIRDRALRKREGERVLSAILMQWEYFRSWVMNKATAEQQELAVLLLTKMLLLDSKMASNTSHPSYGTLLEMYQTLLTDNRTNLGFKNRVLDLLPFFAIVEGPYISKLKSSLDRFVADNFPLKSSEFVKGTPKFNDYIAAIDKLLGAVELSGSPVLLELLISVFCRESRHAHEDEIQATLARFIKRLPADKQKAVLDVPYNIFLKEGSFPNEIRKATIDRVCLPLLRLAQKSTIIDFFLDHIVEIMKMMEAKLLRSSDAGLETQLISKQCCFMLLELLYSRMTKEEINTKNSIINDKFCSGSSTTGKELTGKVIKLTQEAKSEDVRGETTLLEARRQYHCAAYNLMITVISCTQSDAKFFVGFLFADDKNKGQFLLDNIVDVEKTYEFQVELQAPMVRKKKFVSIRNEVRERRAEDGEDESVSYGSSYHLASQYLADSSLSEDVNQYDFSMSGSAQSVTGERGRGRNLRKRPSYAEPEDEEVSVSVTVEDDYVELEMDELNQHECMAAMIALLRHMQRAEITPPIAQGTLPKELPKWMTYLHDKMKNPTVHHNIKLFIARLIVNTADIFQPYAKFWLRSLCQFIFSGPVSTGGMNTFVVDLVVTMMSWHTTAIPQDNAEEKAMASRLVEFLMANIHHDTRQIFRNNLDMLKTLLECWKGRVEIPYEIIYKLLKTTDPKSKDSVTGVQVLGVVMACKFPPYGPSAPVDRERYFQVVSNAMGHHYKASYAAAAEVVGMIFKYLAEKERETEGSFHTHVVTYLSSLQLAKPDNFIVCAHRMQRHYPPIAARFLNKLLFMLPNLHGEYRTFCLEVIHSAIDQVENVFVELRSKGLINFLTHRDEGTQQIALQIVKSIAAKLSVNEVSLLMPSICGFSAHPSTSCRKTMYEVLMWIYDNYREDESVKSHEVMLQTKEALLRGLGDEDLHSRLLVQNFWSSETRLPTGTLDRMVAMLEAMYSPSTEQQYLSYSTNLLLEMTSKSPDYQRAIFEHALSACKFQDYSIRSSWQQRHAVMTPLFASTIASQSMDTSMSEDTLDGGVRATMDVQQFSQTQEGGSHAPFNWLTQSSLDTFSDAFTLGTDTQSQSSLLFSTGGTDSRSRRPRPRRPGPGFGQRPGTSRAAPAAGAGAGDARRDQPETEQQSEILRLKRRFLKDQEQSRLFFAKRSARINKMREEARTEQRKRRENQVTMYRKYRIGDLPDIQIKFSYIIAPLQAVAHRDSTVAKLLFSSLFKAIFAQMDTVKTAREIEEMTEQINTSLESVFSQSSQYFPPFLSCLMDILYELRTSLKVEPSSLGACSIISNLQPLGLTVMEEQLIQCNIEEPRPSKRGKHDTTIVSQDTSLWIELARLYKSIDQYDVLQGIFSGKLDTKTVTSTALKAEARGDYQTARKLYEEALSKLKWEDGNPTDAEVDLWDDSRMECLDHLTQWKALQEVCQSGIDNTDSSDLNKIWDDSFAQDHYLGYLVRSKLKLMLQGDAEQQSLLTFIDSAMKSPDRKELLESRYCFELAMMYLWQEDYDRARHYSALASQKFLQDWSSTDTLMSSSRTHLLQRLQPITELQEFLAFWAKESNFSSAVCAEKLSREWENRSPHLLLDATDTWDDVITNRNVYLDLISGRLAKQSRDDSMEMVEEDMFEHSKLRLKLAMAESARDQNNFTLTLRILKDTHGRCKRVGSESLLIFWSQLYASTHHRKSTCSTDEWTDDTFNNILTTLDQLGKYSGSGVLHERPDLGRRHRVLTGSAYELLASGLTGLDDLKDLTGKTLDKLTEYCGGKKGCSLEELHGQIVEKGFSEMKTSIGGDNDRDVRKSKFGSDEAYLAVAKYCDKVLRDKEDEESDLKSPVLKKFPDTVVVCMLKAMKQGSAEARQRFPRLMQIVEYYPETMGTFIEKSVEVPNWMYIMWLAQMMALLDKKEAPAVQPIVINLATDYPQAVIYPFRISCEGYKFGKSAQHERNRQAVEKISSLLTEERCPLVAKFISALNQFGSPDMLFKDWSEDMFKLLQNSPKPKEEIRDLFNEMYQDLIEEKAGTAAEPSATQISILSSSVSVGFGEYRRKFGDKFRKEIQSHFGKEGQKLLSMSAKDFRKIAGGYQAQFKKLHEGRDTTLVPPVTLKKYCSWMANFNPNRESRELEIPGQYDGLSKPLPEYHVKVAGFDERVLVMSSIRKPKRITIRGNDERDYHYLVKGGEDLRQDQRIEQLFVIMNKVLGQDPACRQRKLRLKTYQVIPMTPRVGLIEWMNNTLPLKDFLLNALTDDEKKYYNSEHGPGKVHQRWTGRFFDEKKGTGFMYSQVYLKYSRTETEREFRLKESKVPWDLSRRAFHQMSTSPEAFHVLRCALATSHAVISVCQYILGIGDRHLSNFMINLKTGHMVGIDFGHAFGSATQFLPVPELMPIRLTRQIVNVMLPLQVKGLLENTMIHVLRALRNDHDLLMATMDVFVKEPSLDWKQFADKQKQAGMETEDADEDEAWYPRQKIQFAQRKLKGDNPCYITRDELRLGHTKNIAIKSFEEVVLGNKKDHIRAKIPKTGLSVEQQVEALIDQATDPNLLGRVWAGWEPWV